MHLEDKNLDKGIKKERKKKKEPLTEQDKKERRKRRKIITIVTILILTLSSIGFLIYKGYLFSKELGFRFEPNTVFSDEEYELEKDPSGKYTNVLLVGIDTREYGGLLNTDTIILASYNHETTNINLVSIPRDFHTEISEEIPWYVRINSIYGNAEQKEEGSGLQALEETVERITGQEIQYYAMVDFKAFVEIIDAVGGIDINVENSFTDYMYPLRTGYKTISFEAGPQTMDGETALEYARSRHSADNNEGSDYARAARQQKVIIAIKDKILSTESLSNPKTVMEILSSVADNVKVSEFNLKDLEAVFEIAKEHTEKDGEIYSFVLGPSIANYEIVERKVLESGAYAIGPKLGLGQYDEIKKFVQITQQHPLLYSEEAKILVYDTGLGYTESLEKTEEIYEQFPYIDITFSGTLFTDKEDSIVYQNYEENNYPTTISTLSEYLGTNLNEKPEYINTNMNGEDVTILLGKQIELEE